MGAVYWQINDCWPVCSWSSIDSEGRWKALQYAARRFFAPVSVTLKPEGNGYAVHVANERREEFRGTTVCIIRDVKGTRLREEAYEVICPAMSSSRVGLILPEEGEALPIVQVVLKDDSGKIVSENEALYTLPKYYPFEKANIAVSCKGREISITADAFCLGVELQAGDARFSDNWVSLYPGETRVLTADRDLQKEELRLYWIK
jgi:beta-mannosidase